MSYFKENKQKIIQSLEQATNKLNNIADGLTQHHAIKCPKCGSTDFIHNNTPYSSTKGFLGFMVAGPVGLIAGNSRGITCKCAKCSKVWIEKI